MNLAAAPARLHVGGVSGVSRLTLDSYTRWYTEKALASEIVRVRSITPLCAVDLNRNVPFEWLNTPAVYVNTAPEPAIVVSTVVIPDVAVNVPPVRVKLSD